MFLMAKSNIMYLYNQIARYHKFVPRNVCNGKPVKSIMGLYSMEKKHHRHVIGAFLSSFKGKIACEPFELVGFERKLNNSFLFVCFTRKKSFLAQTMIVQLTQTMKLREQTIKITWVA